MGLRRPHLPAVRHPQGRADRRRPGRLAGAAGPARPAHRVRADDHGPPGGAARGGPQPPRQRPRHRPGGTPHPGGTARRLLRPAHRLRRPRDPHLDRRRRPARRHHQQLAPRGAHLSGVQGPDRLLRTAPVRPYRAAAPPQAGPALPAARAQRDRRRPRRRPDDRRRPLGLRRGPRRRGPLPGLRPQRGQGEAAARGRRHPCRPFAGTAVAPAQGRCAGRLTGRRGRSTGRRAHPGTGPAPNRFRPPPRHNRAADHPFGYSTAPGDRTGHHGGIAFPRTRRPTGPPPCAIDPRSGQWAHRQFPPPRRRSVPEARVRTPPAARSRPVPRPRG
ncbi:hypothetical protein SGPA1_60086 [Streptomyces misionensis JCM 4497]